MEATPATLVRRTFDHPDETTVFEGNSGHAKGISFSGSSIRHVSFKKGWRASVATTPASTDDDVPRSCYIVSGHMMVQSSDGSTVEFGPGDLMLAPPGHESWDGAWVDRDDCVWVEWSHP